MLRIFRTIHRNVEEIDTIEDGCWIALTDPTARELFTVTSELGIEVDALRAPLDEEERARIEVEDHYTSMIFDIPTTEERNDKEYYITIPVGIFITKEHIVTVCLEDTPILEAFMDGRVRNCWTNRRTRFMLQILNRTVNVYLQYLRMIDKKSDEFAEKMHETTENQALIDMLELEKSLVYISTSLRSNDIVLERLKKVSTFKFFQEDEELLEDVLIDHRQALEMADIYDSVLSGTMDAYASVISNNMNIVMKVLTIISIVMAVPTLIASAWGMNVPVPLAYHPQGFLLLCIISVVLSALCLFVLNKFDML